MRIEFPNFAESLLGGGRGLGDIARIAEGFLHHLQNAFFIFDNQNAIGLGRHSSNNKGPVCEGPVKLLRHKIDVQKIRIAGVDRPILILAFSLLFIESAILLGDLGVINVPGIHGPDRGRMTESVGEVILARQYVRRRGFSSAVWEDSHTKDTLYQNDSVLTLKGSGAKLKLKGGVQIDLHENTLVVLEPTDQHQQDQFRLRFSRGDVRAMSPAQRLRLGSGEWTLDAGAGSDLSLRSVDQGRIEVEVRSGEVSFSHEQNSELQRLESGQRVVLNPNSAEPVQKLNQSMQWETDKDLRIYSHYFPVFTQLRWTGAAEKVRLVSPNRTEQWIDVQPGSQEIYLSLEMGGYYLTLIKGDESSRSLGVHVVPAPSLVYFSPLPRDRVRTGTKTLFTWLSELPSGNYRLEISSDETFSKLDQSEVTPISRTEIQLLPQGALFWRVIGIDDQGFEVPPAFAYPLFSHPNPLDAPKIRAPALEAEPPPPDTSWLDRIWHWIIPQSYAYQKEKPHRPRVPLLFEWEPVDGADHYIIEISSRADFKDPEVIAKVFATRYAWSEYEKKVYFFRIAGGTRSGRLGLFSPPERVDLAKLKPPPKAVTQIPVQKQAPTPRTAPPPPAPPTPAPTATTAPPVQSPPSPPREPWRWVRSEAAMNLGYVSSTQSNSENLKARLAGVQPGISGRIVFARKSWEQHVLGQTGVRIWQPESKSELPFQENVTDIPIHLSWLLKRSDLSFAWGVWFARLPFVTRKDLEAVDLSSASVAGGALEHQFTLGNWQSRTGLNLGLGSGILTWNLRNDWQTQLNATSNWYWGGRLEVLGGAHSPGPSILEFTIGGQFGRRW